MQVGVYATEKVFYDRVYMDQVSMGGLTPLLGMVNMRSPSSVPPALPAIGAIVTYEQDWYALPAVRTLPVPWPADAHQQGAKLQLA